MLKNIKNILMMTDLGAKRIKMDGPLIGTHSGHFHADEALAVFMLRQLPAYAHSPLVRTRDPAILKNCHTVVDVGGEYDQAVRRFDHHQREFNTTFPGHNTKLSSAGLVFLHLGKSVISEKTGLAENSEEVSQIYEKLYTDFIEAFDANDNGISAYDTRELVNAGVGKRFNDRGFSIASCVNRYNYAHHLESDHKAPTTPEQAQDEENRLFERASAFTGEHFILELMDTWKSWLPARKDVEEAFSKRKEIDSSGQILVLPWRENGLPWSDHLYTIEEENNCKGQVLYVLFPENGDESSKWRIRAVSQSPEGFELRSPLPEPWRGIRGAELDQVAGIPGCVFVHASGFIGGNKTYEGALKMAQFALKQ